MSKAVIGSILLGRYGGGLADQFLDKYVNFRYNDGFKLSDRVWRIQEYTQKGILDITIQGIMSGISAVELAEQVEGFLLKRGPAWTTGIKRSVTGRGTVAYNALRLARTEINQAYHWAQKEMAVNNPMLIGQKWNLSNTHPTDWPPSAAYMGYPEICDYRANHDHHGLGEGVFPPGEAPPDHPNGLCYLTDVWKPVEEILDLLVKELEAEERGIDRETPIITPQDFDQEIYDRIKASKYPGNLMLQPEYEEIFLKKGFTREEIETVKKLLSDYGGVAEQQKKAMETIAAEIKNDSRIGKLLRATSDLEEAAVEVWQSGLEDRIKKAIKAAKEDWDLFGQAEGFSKDYSDFSEVETAIRMRLEKEASLVVYRKGDLGRPIESWTTDPLGADIGGGRRLIPDHAMTLSEMHERGYKILGGTCRMMGAPGEMEITFINFDKYT